MITSSKLQKICASVLPAVVLLGTTAFAEAPVASSKGGSTFTLTAPKPSQEATRGGQGSHLFGPTGNRLHQLRSARTFGSTPQPTDTTLERYERVVDRTVEADNVFDLVVGRPRLLVFNKIPIRVQIPNEEIAYHTVISKYELSVTGVAPGSTTLNVWFPSDDDPDQHEVLSYLVRVIPDPETRRRTEEMYSALETEINAAFPESRIELALVGDKLAVRGQAKDVIEAAQIISVVQSQAPQGKEIIPTESLPPVNLMNPTASDLPAIRNYLLGGHPNIINMIKVPGEAQIMLKVTIAEVNRAAARSIGFNFSAVDDYKGKFTGANLTGRLLKGGANIPFSYTGNHQFQAALKALRGLNMARSLAEPTLVTLNGKEASFKTGGSFPVPKLSGGSSGNATVSGVEFEDFGVQLKFTPFTTDRDKVRLVIEAEVSTRDEGGGSSISGSSIPGLEERNFNTTVELREGQTLAIAGILQSSYTSGNEKLPLLGDLPFIGNLFGTSSTTNNEQELVVLVTPELVYPMEQNEIPALPGSDVFEPDDFEFFFLNRLESRAPLDYRSAVQNDFDRMRHRRLQQVFINGPMGYANDQEVRLD